ncbi:MAG: glycosyltransferase family 4 protein [Armatimonadetes bacterium]|nr:glycosyltransferase family 4 protein [Armatimonadota bacterium]
MSASSIEPPPPSGVSPSPLRILHLVSSLQVGGMERFVLRIASAQRRRGHTVEVVALKGGPLQSYADELDVPVTALRGGMPQRMAGMLAFVARFRPQVLNAHNPSSLHYAVMGKGACGARVVMTYHGKGLGDPRTPGLWEWRRTDAIVAVSAATAEVIRQDAQSRLPEITVIHNGIDPSKPQRSREDVRADLNLGETLTGIVVARVDRLKDHASLLRAMALLREIGVPLTLLIAGDGPERESLENLARELRLQEEARFLGFRSDVPDLLAASDFFVLPSTTEGLPLSVLEAMAQGLPVVATAVGGVPELIEDGRSGILVPPKDPATLAAALLSIAKDPAVRAALGQAARRRVEDEFTFTAMVEQYNRLYHRLCS